MRLKLITALSLVLVFTFLFSAQAGYANHLNPTPMTSPTTGPVTGPVTGPITGPSGLFTITGNVSDHITRLFKKSFNRIIPESGVTVNAKDIFNGNSASATTDANGNYIITLNQRGYYKVSVSDGDAKFYSPPLHFVHLTDKKKAKSGVNFKGYIFEF